MRSTGTYAVSTTLGEPVRAFIPYALAPTDPPLAPESYLNRTAELALARLAGVSGLVPMMPRFSIAAVQQKLAISFPTANARV